MKDSEILRIVAARVAEDRGEHPGILMSAIIASMKYTGQPADQNKAAQLQIWIWSMLGSSMFTNVWLRKQGIDLSTGAERVWTVCWLRRLIDMCVAEEGS
jgi:hypothetical protein